MPYHYRPASRLHRLSLSLRAWLLRLRVRVLYGKESIPFAKELAAYARFYHFLVAELGPSKMQELATKNAAIFSTDPALVSALLDFRVIVSIIAHPDRISIRFPCAPHPGEIDYRLSELAASMAAAAQECNYPSGLSDRGVRQNPTQVNVTADQAFAAWQKMSAQWNFDKDNQE